MLDSRKQLGFDLEPRVLGIEPGRIREQHQQRGSNQVRNDCGQSIVVAKPEFVDHNRVVFIDYRHNPAGQHTIKCFTSVQVLVPIGQNILGEQDLTDQPFLCAELGCVPLHQTALPDSRGGLQVGHLRGAMFDSQFQKPGGHGSRAHQNRWMPLDQSSTTWSTTDLRAAPSKPPALEARLDDPTLTTTGWPAAAG